MSISFSSAAIGSAWNITMKAINDGPGLPPGTGPTRLCPKGAEQTGLDLAILLIKESELTHRTEKFVGPWFSTQMILSLTIGISSFCIFCILRTRWDVVYMGRTKLKYFSPTPAHSPDNQKASGGKLLGWIMPTVRTSEFTVLQTVGLDAAVLLDFFRMSFLLFSLAAILATVVLMPLNYFKHGTTDSEPDDPPDNSTSFASTYYNPTNTSHPLPPTLSELILDPQTSATINLLFTYLFTALTLSFLHRNFNRFVQSRQAFALHLTHSISARTVLVTNIPQHLRGDRALATYFEGCGWQVESVSVCRQVGKVRAALEKRTEALLSLEKAWSDWMGNPASPVAKGYNPRLYTVPRKRAALRAAAAGTESPEQVTEPLIPGLDDESSTANAAPSRESSGEPSRMQTDSSNGDGSNPWLATTSSPEDPTRAAENGMQLSATSISTNRPRPTYRPRWFGTSVDAIEYWEKRFLEADTLVRTLRKTGSFEATHAAFVTFDNINSAQMACQVVHYAQHSQVVTQPAPEPRDVVWSQIGISAREGMIRFWAVMAAMGILLSFWIPPVSALASLLSYEEIKKALPWLARIIKTSPRLAAIVQNSLPSLALITFNALLPFLLSWLCYQQGFVSRSGTEYSLMRKYYLFLLISVLFVFLLTTTYLALIRDLADSPMKIPEKLAAALQASNARNFMVSYVMLQALGLMPLQLLNLGPLFSLGFARGFYTKTPRDYAEANAPPMLNFGWVYPPALLVFTITLVYSVVSPLILVFGAMYFGTAYVAYKYKLLFIYFKPYESNGEAWLITFRRLVWALILFQIFMAGLFSLGQASPYLSLAMVPLTLYTLWWSYSMTKDFKPLSTYLALSSVCEVQRGEGADQAAGVRDESIPSSQSNLNHRRYGMNDETLYVAPSSKHTDYSQPPLNNFYSGVLNTGRRRYAHPALSGKLPFPWLPAVAKPRAFGDGAKERRGVVLSLRRKTGQKLNRGKGGSEEGQAATTKSSDDRGLPNDWVTEGRWDDGANAGDHDAQGRGVGSSSSSSSNVNPWGETSISTVGQQGRQPSYNTRSGVIALPDESNVWDDPESEEEDTAEAVSPSTYFHRPERRRSMGGSDATLDATPGLANRSSQNQLRV